MDLLIKNGTIVTASGSYEADVAVKDGKIAEIGKNLDISADKTVDASGKLVLPGAIDVHTHLAIPKEVIRSYSYPLRQSRYKKI